MFVHLHVHSDYSLLHSCITMDRLAERAAEYHMGSIALTDINTTGGFVSFYRTCRSKGIQPIFGLELSVRQDHDEPIRLVLLAENHAGYQNLLLLSSIEPPVSWETLASHRKGLIATTGSTQQGLFRQAVSDGRTAMKELHRRGLRLFGASHWYVQLELDTEAKKNRSRRVYDALKEESVNWVAAQEGCVLEDGEMDALACMRALDKGTLAEEAAPEQRPLLDPASMERLFAELPSAVENTVAIASRCRVDIDMESAKLPNADADLSLYDAAIQQLTQRGEILEEESERRLAYECGIIDSMGFADYFFIVADIVRFAKEQDIPVGPGRGSAAGSFTAYALGITEINPLEHGLMFERFLNPNRKELPDIDLDFCAERREEILAYLLQRYGYEYTAQIGSYGTFGVRAALRDAARTLQTPDSLLQRCLQAATEERNEPDWKQLQTTLPEAAALLRTAAGLYGRKRSLGVHAAGVILGREPLIRWTGIRTDNRGHRVTQMDMDSVQALGLLKIDILALRTLTLLREAESMIQRRQRSFRLAAVDAHSPEAYKLLAAGDSPGIFQLESRLFQDLLQELQPRSLQDLSALLAIGRPGPLQFAQSLARRRRGEEEPASAHPRLEPILKETQGILLYQEQVMQAVHDIGQLPLADADELRKALSKKQRHVLQRFQDAFVQGAGQLGIPSAQAQHLFREIQRFGGYAFNKSHSTSYAWISYQCAYLKAHYPAEFFASLLHHGDSQRQRRYLLNAMENGVAILPPDIRYAQASCCPEGRGIRVGIAFPRGLNTHTARQIMEWRDSKPAMMTLAALASTSGVTAETIAALIKTGALDFLGSRSQLWKEAQNMGMTMSPSHPSCGHWAQWEKELLGVYLSCHPVEPWLPILQTVAEGFECCAAGEICQLEPADGVPREGLLQTTDGVVRFQIASWPKPLHTGQLAAVLGTRHGREMRAQWILPLTTWYVLSPDPTQFDTTAAVLKRHSGTHPVLLALGQGTLQLAAPELWVNGSGQFHDELLQLGAAVEEISPTTPGG